MFGMAKMLAGLLAVPALALQGNPRRGTPPSRALRSDPHGTLGVRLPVFDASLVDDEELVATAVDAPVAAANVDELAADIDELAGVAGVAADELAGAVDDDAVALCSRMFARFARGQELLRRNHGVPVLHGPATLDRFVRDLNVHHGVPVEATEMLQRMRSGALMNGAGGTRGGRLQMSVACLNKEPAFQDRVKELYFGRADENVHFELFPSTTKSIEAFASLLAHEASLRERPIKLVLPADAHYCWTNVLGKYAAHPFLSAIHVSPDDDAALEATRLRAGDLAVGVFTLANTVSGKSTDVDWFQNIMARCARDGADAAVFVDAALAGCCVARDVLDRRGGADPAAVRAILDGALGVVQSGFKDFGLSSMIFLDDARFECCARGDGRGGLQAAVAGGAHALITHAPVTSIPESPSLAFLIFAREYTQFRKRSFDACAAAVRGAIPADVATLRPRFPLLVVEFADADVCAELTALLEDTYSLITIDAEPNALRLWPTPTNHDVAAVIKAHFYDKVERASNNILPFTEDP